MIRKEAAEDEAEQEDASEREPEDLTEEEALLF